MQVKAKKLSKKIKVREITKIVTEFNCIHASGYEAVFEVSQNSHIILYSFGVCVFVNVDTSVINKFLTGLRTAVAFSDEIIAEDFYEIKIDPESMIVVAHNYVLLPEYKIEYVRIISLVLAESVAMEYYEIKTEDILEKSTSHSLILQNKGSYPRKIKDLFKFIGFAITTRQEILSNLYISDNPDETWNNPVIEKLFLEIKDMFDIEQRFRSINMSLNAIQQSLEIIVDMLQARKGHNLEWLIIILIFIEVIIYIGMYF